MCKVFAINNLENVTEFEFVANVVKEHITKTNDDGYGFAVKSELGISGFKTVNYSINYEPETFSNIKNVISNSGFQYIGNHSFKQPVSAIFHGRTSTNKEGIKNAHPIMLNNQCIVHNGVVSLKKSKYKQKLDTDSELLTVIYPDLKKNLETNVTGYYAFLNLLESGEIQVVKDSIASLVIGFCPEINSHIIATDEDLILSVAKDLSWTITSVYDVQHDTIFNIGQNNVIKDIQKFESLGYTRKQSKLAKTSLGRDLDKNIIDLSTSNNYEQDALNWAKDLCLEEFKLADASWSFYHGHRQISLNEFNSLNDEEKLECYVIDWQGEEISPEMILETMDDVAKGEVG